MKKPASVLFAGVLLLCGCASSDDQLPSSPSASSPVITTPSNNGTPVTLSGYADTSATAQSSR